MVYQQMDGLTFKMGQEYDFSFLQSYGRVFKIFDDQDSGNICFGVENGGTRYFVKFAGAPTEEYAGRPADAVERLKATLPVYREIRHDSLIRFLHAEEVGGGFAMVFDWAEGKCMGRMYPEEHRCVMNLPISEKNGIFDAVLGFLRHVAEAGYVAVDFYDGSILYDPASRKTTICDIDFFQKRPYTNAMGRMWGSERFMAPEEYELGATIDEVTNVFTAGQMAFALYADSDRSAEAWPLPRSCFEAAKMAIRENRAERFQSIAEFRDAWNASME